MFDREEVRLAKTGLRLIRLDDGRIIMMEASLMANDPPSIWNGIQSLQTTISSAASRLEIIAQCKCNILLHFYNTKKIFPRNIGSKKLSTSRGRRQQGTHCMLLLPWPDGLLWAGLRYLRWTWQWSPVGRGGTFHVRAKQGIVSRASGPTPGIWRTQVHCTYSGSQTYPSHPYAAHKRLVLCSYAETLLMLLCFCLIIISLFQCDFVCGRYPSEILLLANCFGGRGNKVLNNLKLIWNHGCSWPMEHRQELQDGCDHKCSCGDLGDSNTPDLKHQHNHSWFKSSYTLCLTFTNCGGIFTMPWS